MVVNEVFGLPTAAVYPNDLRHFSGTPELISLAGHVGDVKTHELQTDILVKTHDVPTDERTAIYIVRDGRAAIVSYYHYRNELENDAVTIEDVIKGPVWPCSWSEHVQAWNPIQRKNTLLLRYEEIVSNPANCIAQIGDFLSRKPIKDLTVNFEKLHTLQPKFFRSGNNDASIREIEPYIETFNEHHGHTMRMLGYYR